MKDGILSLVVMTPLIPDSVAPSRTPTNATAYMSMPILMASLAQTMASRPCNAPTDRSISPEMNTKVLPTAMIPITEICLSRLRRLSSVKKVSVEKLSATNITSAAKMTDNSRELLLNIASFRRNAISCRVNGAIVEPAASLMLLPLRSRHLWAVRPESI